MADDDILICAPVGMGPTTYPNSRLGICASCDCGILINPTSEPIIADHPGIQTLCIECSAKRITEVPGEIQGLNQDQVREIESHLIRRNTMRGG